MKTLRITIRILVGAVFIFSAFVKGIDPLGSEYKFVDYFVAFGMPKLEFLAFPLSFFLSVAEFIIGVALLWGIRMRFFSWAVLVFMAGFTVLTFILALFNPVSDCGCFGDAIIMTNWETFLKNLVIMALVIFIFLNKEKYTIYYKETTEWGIAGTFTVLFFIFCWYNYKHLPVMDYRPYHIGSYLPEKMTRPEDAPEAEYETIFYYQNKNSGKVKKFNEENYPWEDTANWEFVKYENKQISEGYIPPVHDFNITSPKGTDIQDKILADENYSFLLVSYDLAGGAAEGYKKSKDIIELCSQSSIYSFYGITSSSRDEINKVKEKHQLDATFYTADEITLKTIIRSNPGLVLLKNGTVIGKWHYNDIPTTQHMDEHYFADLLNDYRNQYENRIAIIFSLVLILLILTFIEIKRNICK